MTWASHPVSWMLGLPAFIATYYCRLCVWCRGWNPGLGQLPLIEPYPAPPLGLISANMLIEKKKSLFSFAFSWLVKLSIFPHAFFFWYFMSSYQAHILLLFFHGFLLMSKCFFYINLYQSIITHCSAFARSCLNFSSCFSCHLILFKIFLTCRGAAL